MYDPFDKERSIVMPKSSKSTFAGRKSASKPAAAAKKRMDRASMKSAKGGALVDPILKTGDIEGTSQDPKRR